MELASLKIGDRCPFSIRSVRVAHAPSSRPGEKPVRTASGSLAASRELQSQNSSKAADPSLPDPEDLVLDLDSAWAPAERSASGPPHVMLRR